MKKNIVTIITVLAYVMFVAGAFLTFKGIQEASSTYASRQDPTPFFVAGISLIVGFPFTLGFRYIVEAAVTYLEKSTKQKESAQQQ